MVQSPLFRWKYILHFIWKSRSQSLEEEWRGTESMLLEVQCEVSSVSDNLGCHVICWCWSTVFSEVHSQRSYLPGNFRALHASFCWQALWRCWFHFPAGLGTCPHCQRYQKLVQWLFSLALNGGGRIFFRSPSSPLFSLPACSLVSSRNWETLSALLSKLENWIWSTGLSTQLTPSSRREARVRGNLTALTERSQLATRWTRGTGGVSCV